MLTPTSLPVLLLLLGFPFGFPGFRQPHPPAPRDTLPPVWKSASRLALEDRFVIEALPRLAPSPAGLRLADDPRQLRVAVDPDSGTLSFSPEMRSVALGVGARQGLNQYSEDLTRRNFRRLWQERTRQSINSRLASAAPAPVTGLAVQFPSPLPKRVQSLLGPGGPALRVAGSENVRLSGQSTWSNQQSGLLGQRRSLFPSLDMQQDLNITLEGQLSDRVKVNLLQNSANQIPLANRVAVNYRGDEDDLVQALDLGNTNLSLPGTQYVSYSGKNEGLFGVKAATRIGPLDFTVLASKQEGRSERASYAGGSSRQSQTLADLDYVRGVYFLLYDPNLYVYDIPDSSVRVYLDDYNYGNDVNSVRGRALVNPTPGDTTLGADTSSVRGTFSQLVQGADQDYEILPDVYGPLYKVLRLHRTVTGEQRLAVTYAARQANQSGQGVGDYLAVGGQIVPDADGVPALRMKLLRAPTSQMKVDAVTGNYDPSGTFTSTRELELRNFYQLAGQRIDPKSLRITVRYGVEDPPITFHRARDGTPIPYIEALGLDNYDESGSTPVFGGHDGVVDATILNSSTARLFVDPESGTLFFPDPRPFAPRLGPGGKPFDRAVSAVLSRRDSLVGAPDSLNAANPAIYDKYYLQRALDTIYYIDAEFTAARVSNEITLGRGNIVEGSDVVTVNGQPLVRDRDYTIDYDLGRVTLKRQLSAADQLNVDYSYAPLFQQAGRTLLGSAFRLEGRDRSLGGAFLYESRGAQDLRPRLGEEPSRSLIGDLNTDWRFRPEWVTRLVDRLPGIRTTAPSEFNVQAEVGASFPNPNTRNEVYIDDMEGVRDAVSLSMGPERWHWSSVPTRHDSLLSAVVGRPGVPVAAGIFDAEVHWYSPPAVVKERDLKPTLTDAEGAQSPHQVLAVSVPRRPTMAQQGKTPGPTDPLWFGLTYLLDQTGVDVSRSQFIELWIDDFHDEHEPGRPHPRLRGENVRLHIDLGVVSEDQMRAPNVPANGRMDTEDQKPWDDQLTVTDKIDEDTGVDGVLNRDEHPDPAPDLVTADPGRDPNGDDFHSTDGRFKEIDPRRYRFTNGTEDSRTVNPVPDTEDLNLNDNLDTQEDYFEYTIALGDTASPYLVTDVRKEYAGVRSDNGWRRYRIPLADTLRVAHGLPDLTRAQHVRVWVENVVDVDPEPPPGDLGAFEQRPLLMLGGLDIVGSRWQATDLSTEKRQRGATLTLNSVNSVDNADVYVPPFNPGETRTGSQSLVRREQSLALEFTNFQHGDTLEAYKIFSIDEDYSRYGKLTWYAAGFQIPGYSAAADSLTYFVRFASDERGQNYYEYRARVPASSGPRAINWQPVSLRLTDLSNQKLDPHFPRTDPILFRAPGAAPGEEYVVHGRPSFTRLRRVSFGLINGHSDTTRTFLAGQLWFDELRATDVARDAGYAERVLVSGRMANLANYNLAWTGRDENFLSVGETRGSGNRNENLSLSGNLEPHRFFEGTGIVLPVALSYQTNSVKPRFTAGDDVVRTGAVAAASESHSESRSWSVGYSRSWSERSNPFLRYTLGGITTNMHRSTASSRTPSSVDTSVAFGATVNYSIQPRRLLTLAVPGTKLKLYPLPENVYWNYSLDTRESRSYDRLRDSTGTLALRNSLKGRSAFIDFGGDSRPFDLLHHHFEGRRNLTLRDDLREHVGMVNLGRVVSWRQNMDTHYALNRGPWLRPSVTWASNYAQSNGPELSDDLSVRAVTNGQTMSMGWELPFDRFGAKPIQAQRDTGRAAAPPQLLRWLSRLGAVGTDASLTKTSSHSRLAGTPSFLYLLGLSSDPGLAADSSGRVRAEFGNQSTDLLDWNTSARSRVPVVFDMTLSARGSYGQRNATVNGVRNRSANSRFPDVDVEYGKVAKVVHLDRFFRNPRLHTSYNRSTTTDYTNSTSPTAISRSSEWRPLLGLTGDLKNGTHTELRVERRVTQRENRLLGNSITTDRNTDLNFNVNRAYSQGQKVRLLGKQAVVKSSVSLGLTAVYSRRSGETVSRSQPNQAPLFPTKEDRLSVNGTGSYGFSNNVTGNVSLGFGQNRNLQRDIVTRNVRVELRAAFTF